MCGSSDFPGYARTLPSCSVYIYSPGAPLAFCDSGIALIPFLRIILEGWFARETYVVDWQVRGAVSICVGIASLGSVYLEFCEGVTSWFCAGDA